MSAKCLMRGNVCLYSSFNVCHCTSDFCLVGTSQQSNAQNSISYLCFPLPGALNIVTNAMFPSMEAFPTGGKHPQSGVCAPIERRDDGRFGDDRRLLH